MAYPSDPTATAGPAVADVPRATRHQILGLHLSPKPPVARPWWTLRGVVRRQRWRPQPYIPHGRTLRGPARCQTRLRYLDPTVRPRSGLHQAPGALPGRTISQTVGEITMVTANQ